MSKSIKELRKENAFLKSKTERSDITLIELVEEVKRNSLILTIFKGFVDFGNETNKTLFLLDIEQRERLKKQLEKTKNQKDKLESLCRSLQAERKQKETTNS